MIYKSPNLFLLENFVTRHSSICEDSLKYDPHESLIDAKLACDNDTHCIGIVDDNCNRIKPFHLCKIGFVTLDQNIEHCVYQKKNYIGTLQIVNYICLTSLIYVRYSTQPYYIDPLEPESECFDVSLHKISHATSWKLGACSSSLQYSIPGIYIEKCCISPGDHILTCMNPEGNDWSRSALNLLGHEFCNDYVGNTAMIPLNIKGNIKGKKLVN